MLELELELEKLVASSFLQWNQKVLDGSIATKLTSCGYIWAKKEACFSLRFGFGFYFFFFFLA